MLNAHLPQIKQDAQFWAVLPGETRLFAFIFWINVWSFTIRILMDQPVLYLAWRYGEFSSLVILSCNFSSYDVSCDRKKWWGVSLGKTLNYLLQNSSLSHVELQVADWHGAFNEIFIQKKNILLCQFQVPLAFIKPLFLLLGSEERHVMNTEEVRSLWSWPRGH